MKDRHYLIPQTKKSHLFLLLLDYNKPAWLIKRLFLEIKVKGIKGLIFIKFERYNYL